MGTRVEVDTGEFVIYRQRKGGVSMESANDPRLSIGVGAVPVLKKITIRWPSGIVTTREDLKVDQEYKIVEPKDGGGRPRAPGPGCPARWHEQAGREKKTGQPKSTAGSRRRDPGRRRS